VASVSFSHKVKTSITNIQQLFGLSHDRKKRDYQKIVRQNIFRKFSKTFAYAGPLVTLISFIISPGLYTAVLLMAHLAFLLFFKKMAVKSLPKPWGEVFNLMRPKEKLGNAVIRLFDSQYGRLLLTQVTSNGGRYGFLVGNEKYILTCEKPGFALPGDKLEITGQREQGIIKKDIGLEPASSAGGTALAAEGKNASFAAMPPAFPDKGASVLPEMPNQAPSPEKRGASEPAAIPAVGEHSAPSAVGQSIEPELSKPMVPEAADEGRK
jgi:hypothetical protein